MKAGVTVMVTPFGFIFPERLLAAYGDLQWLMKLGCEGGDWEPGNLVMCKDFGRLNNGDRLGLLNLSAINLRKTATITSSGAPAEGFNLQR